MIGHDDAADATEEHRTWQEVLIAAAALQGASSPPSRPSSTDQALPLPVA
ncbi:hypothetical protein [Streptomyces sp. NPDC058612]